MDVRVLVTIFEQLVPLSGGGTPRISNITKSFINNGHEVYVACAIRVTKREAINTLGCVDIKPLINVSRLSKKKMLKYMYAHPVNILLTAIYSLKNGPDMIISHNSIAGFSGLIARFLMMKRCLAVVNFTDLLFEYLQDYKGGKWMKLVEILGRKLESYSIRKSDRVITISKCMKNILTDIGADGDRIDVICDGVDTGIFKRFDRNNFRKIYGNGAENIIIFQGVIDPQDGPELVIETSRKVIAKHPKTMFWIIGDGTAIPDLKKMATEKGVMNNFYFSGWVKQQEVPKYISASDIGLVILPDVLSARGRVTLKEFEYWACGIPAVLPRLPALEEIAKDSNAAVFYESGNGVSLAEKICMLIEDKNLRKTMGENGKKLVHEKYEWRTLTNQIVNLCERYREILS